MHWGLKGPREPLSLGMGLETNMIPPAELPTRPHKLPKVTEFIQNKLGGLALD